MALEAIALMAAQALNLRADLGRMQDALRDRHFARKHGATAYYGQPD